MRLTTLLAFAALSGLSAFAADTTSNWQTIVDVADPAVSDDLEAGCECGPYTLSRQQLIQQIADGEKRVIVGG